MRLILLLSMLFSISAWANLPDVATLVQQSEQVDWDYSISRSIIIDAPVAKVWRYASDSTKASDWSVYFDHISPLPGEFTDGKVGSLRRCFKYADESGEYWDEVTIEVIPERSRKIVSYNFTNYPLPILYRNQYAFVRQLYESVGENQTKMTFQTIRPKNSKFVWKIIFRKTRDEVGEIFHLNLENIKAAIEGQNRLHPWRE